MNSDIQPVKNHTFKRENLRKTQIHKRNNTNDLQVTSGAPRKAILGNLNQSNGRKLNSNLESTSSYISPSSAKNISPDKSQTRKLKIVDSKQVSGPIHQADKKTFLDTYARIVATNNRRCPKRLRELAKPKRQARNNEFPANFDLNYDHGTKTYMTEIRRGLKESKKK